MRRRDPSRLRLAAHPEELKRLRASRAIVFTWDEGELLACNYLTGQTSVCFPDLIELLSALQDWQSVEDIIESYPGITSEALDSLVETSLLVEQVSPIARQEQEYLVSWNWGVSAAMFHFCLQDASFMALEEAEEMQRAHAEVDRSPPLHTPNTGRFDDIVTLDEHASKDSVLTEIMARRRTIRECDDTASIALGAVADCLYAGLGITGWTENCVGKLPLSMTPSGGARNPFEAYLIVKRVDGLAPGVYHYSALENSLGKVNDLEPQLSELVAGQDWADSMSCAIVLCASLGRTMWKYTDPNAYRVVMIEAGHIAQNIMLAATSHGLTACPTAALSHSKVRQIVDKDQLIDAPLYALTIGVPAS